MIRLILRLLNIRDYEVCQSCETLKQQLEFANAEKRELTNTLLNILRPNVIEAEKTIEIKPLLQHSALFSRKRAALEERDRLAAQTLKNSTNIGKPDITINNPVNNDIESLEEELGVEEEKTN